jgi:hypothetical protein
MVLFRRHDPRCCDNFKLRSQWSEDVMQQYLQTSITEWSRSSSMILRFCYGLGEVPSSHFSIRLVVSNKCHTYCCIYFTNDCAWMLDLGSTLKQSLDWLFIQFWNWLLIIWRNSKRSFYCSSRSHYFIIRVDTASDRFISFQSSFSWPYPPNKDPLRSH